MYPLNPYFYGLNHNNIVISYVFTEQITRIEGNLWKDSAKGYLFNVSHLKTLNEQACPPIQIYATDIEDLYVTQDPLAIHLLEVNTLNVEDGSHSFPQILSTQYWKKVVATGGKVSWQWLFSKE